MVMYHGISNPLKKNKKNPSKKVTSFSTKKAMVKLADR